MTYTFDAFAQSLDTNWYDDDDLLKRLLAKYGGPATADAEPRLREWGALCSNTLRELAETSARPENQPTLRHYDAYNRRVDEVVLPASTEEALRIVEGRHRMGAAHGDAYAFYAKGYLFSQNGEAGVGCSVACTEGMVRLLEALGDHPVHAEAVRRVRESTYEQYAHGAQFVTEIQGGSDAAQNALVARRDGERWTLHGPKWFCSNINADYFVVTGRPEEAGPGARGVALFFAPAYRDDHRGERNGYTIDRLKDKLGTRELATAEVTFEGAEAYPVGDLDQGLSNVVSLVLVTSRFACANIAASFLRRAERIATAYAEFRRAFGYKLTDFPLIQATLDELRGARSRALATLFELVQMWKAAREADDPGSPEALDFRYMMSLCKPALTWEATALLHEAIMVLGGNGVEERFSALPRLWRDAIIMETWEGPHNVLYSQALRDMVRFEVDAAGFVARVAGPGRKDLASELSEILGGARDLSATVPFAAVGKKLVRAFGERLLEELE